MLALWGWRRLAGASWRAWLSARGPGGEAHTRTTIAFVLGSQDRTRSSKSSSELCRRRLDMGRDHESRGKL